MPTHISASQSNRLSKHKTRLRWNPEQNTLEYVSKGNFGHVNLDPDANTEEELRSSNSSATADAENQDSDDEDVDDVIVEGKDKSFLQYCDLRYVCIQTMTALWPTRFHLS